MREAIGIDLGRNPAIGILSEFGGRILERREVAIPLDTPYEYAVGKIKELVGKLRQLDVRGICLGSPGSIDSERGICRFSPNYPQWKEADLVSSLKEEFGIPVFAINDVNAATLGEMNYGAGKLEMKSETPIYLTVSEGYVFEEGGRKKNDSVGSMVLIAVGLGIGSGIIINGELISGFNNVAGEVGHITIEPEGPQCSCGNNGCLESLASLNAFRRGYNEALRQGWSTVISDYVHGPEGITFKIIEECAKKNDELTMKLLGIMGKYLGMGIAMIVNMMDPELIVIGGDTAPLFGTLYPHIMKELKHRVKMVDYSKVNFVPAKLGELSGAYGAAAYVFKRLYE